MELRHLRYFDAVASTLSFSRAAERLHMSQPPLSRQIRQMEDELGAVLIDRATRPMSLTPAGRFFHDQTLQMLQKLAEVQESTRRIADGGRAWFGIGFVPSVLYGVLPDLIRNMRDTHPAMEVSLQEMMTIQQSEALRTGRIDVGFGRLPLNDPAIHCETIFEEPLVVALPARHRFRSRRKLSLAELAREPLVLYPARPRPSYADQVLEVFRSHGLVPNVVQQANELQTAIGLVSAGVGLALVPASVQRLHRDDVVYIALSDRGVVSPVIMNTRVGDESEGLAAFRRLVAARQPA